MDGNPSFFDTEPVGGKFSDKITGNPTQRFSFIFSMLKEFAMNFRQNYMKMERIKTYGSSFVILDNVHTMERILDGDTNYKRMS